MKKKIIILGASSGIGRELARQYAAEGHAVLAVARRQELLDTLQQEFPAQIKVQAADIRQLVQDRLLATLIETLGGLDLLILAASVVRLNPALDERQETETLAVNAGAFQEIMLQSWHWMAAHGGGQLAGITSIAAARGNKVAPSYHATKAFQSVLLEGLRVKARAERNGIVVTELIPGYVQTAMGKGDRVFWSVTAEKAATQIRKAITKKRSRAFIPKRWWWIFHIQRLLPIFIYDRLVNSRWKTGR